MALLDTLPADWSTYAPADKIDYFNANNISPVELAAVGVPASDLAWMQNNGYEVKATPTELLTAMQSSNSSPEQMAQALAIPVGEIVSTVAEALQPTQNVNLGGTWIQPIYDSTGQGETFQQGPLKEVLTYKENQTTGDTYKQYNPSGELVGTNKFQEVGGLGQMLKETGRELGPIALAALTAGGAGGMLGSSLGLTGTAANVAGGALLGGGGAALTGGNVLQGALLGGAGGYVSSLLNAGVADPELLQAAYDADIAGGMVPEFGTNAAYDTFMQSAMTPAAQAAIEAQIANSSVAGLTPAQIATQGGMLTDIASGTAMGPMTADQLGTSFQEYLAQAGYNPTLGMTAEQLAAADALGGAEVAGGLTAEQASSAGLGGGFNTAGMTPEQLAAADALGSSDVAGGLTTEQAAAAGLGGGIPAAAAGTGLLSSLTPSQIANLIKAGVTVAGLTGAAKLAQPSAGTSTGVATAPTQVMPTYTPEYYQQLQQYYNAYLPQTPRDVVGPLQQWYNAKSGA